MVNCVALQTAVAAAARVAPVDDVDLIEVDDVFELHAEIISPAAATTDATTPALFTTPNGSSPL